MTVPCVHVSLEIHKAWPTQPGTHPVLVCVCVCLKITERERWERQSQRTVCIHQFQASIAFHLHPTGSIHNITFYIVFVAPASYLTASGHIKIVSQSRGRHFFYAHFVLEWHCLPSLHLLWKWWGCYTASLSLSSSLGTQLWARDHGTMFPWQPDITTECWH